MIQSAFASGVRPVLTLTPFGPDGNFNNFLVASVVNDQTAKENFLSPYGYHVSVAVAPVSKVRQVVEYAVTRIPTSKIDLGIPNYGYDWTLPFVRGNNQGGHHRQSLS